MVGPSGGSVQARLSPNDPRLYNVNRDVAHNFAFVVGEVARCLEEGRWPALTRLAAARGVSDEDLGRACAALARFVAVQADDPAESMAACLARCGFLELPETAQVVVMAYLGTVTLGIHHRGVREATLGGRGPADDYRALAEHGRRCAGLMRLPRWRRRWLRFVGRLRRAWRAFRDVTPYDG